MGLLNTSSVLILPNRIVPSPVDVFSISPKAISSGNNISTANILKKSCTVDAAKARLNSFPRLICPIETIVFVTVVPMFAPMIIGIAPVKVMAPPETIPTMRDVVVEELWNKVVAKIPINSEIKGSPVAVMMPFAKSPPNCFMPEERPLIPTRKRYKDRITPTTFWNINIFLFKSHSKSDH